MLCDSNSALGPFTELTVHDYNELIAESADKRRLSLSAFIRALCIFEKKTSRCRGPPVLAFALNTNDAEQEDGIMPKHSKYKGLSAQPGNYSQDIKDFGANVRKYREMRGLSLDALGDLIDSDKGAVSKLENGDRIPRYDTVLKLADALKITPAMFSPSRFADIEGVSALSEIHRLLLQLPADRREAAAMYICAMLEGLYLRSSKDSDSDRQKAEGKKN